MKEKLKILLCAVMIFVFSFGTCSTAYARTGYPEDYNTALSIVKSYYKDNEIGNTFALLKSPDGKVSLVTFGRDIFLFGDKNKVIFKGVPFSNDSFILLNRPDPDWYTLKVYAFDFDSLNMYSKPVKRTLYDDVHLNAPNPHPCGYFRGWSLIQSPYNIYQRSDTGEDILVFPQGETNSPTPDPPGSLVPGSNILSSTVNKNSEMLNGVLNEILVLLPLLLPVLISFLAIRKGIKFTLQTLRSA